MFLASSFELKSHRKEFELFISRKNPEFVRKGVFIELILWEDFIDHMSQSRLQDEYNKAVEGCDIFVSMFRSKVGKYTEEEFFKAVETFLKKGKPLIYTYFHDTSVNIRQIEVADISSLRKFEQMLDSKGHFPTYYTDIDHLKYKFSVQLDKLMPKILE